MSKTWFIVMTFLCSFMGTFDLLSGMQSGSTFDLVIGPVLLGLGFLNALIWMDKSRQEMAQGRSTNYRNRF